jgi:hypothetical protein
VDDVLALLEERKERLRVSCNTMNGWKWERNYGGLCAIDDAINDITRRRAGSDGEVGT